MEQFFLLYLIIINFITFIIYVIDKWKAKRGYWRISEKTLFLLAIVGGSIGALAAMKVFRHKTQHLSFKLGIPTILVIQIVAFVLYFMK